MEVQDFFEALASHPDADRNAVALRDRLYGHVGRLLISAAEQPMSDNLHEQYAHLTASVFSRMPSYVRFDVTEDMADALQKILPEDVNATVEARLDVISATGVHPAA